MNTQIKEEMRLTHENSSREVGRKRNAMMKFMPLDQCWGEKRMDV